MKENFNIYTDIRKIKQRKIVFVLLVILYLVTQFTLSQVNRLGVKINIADLVLDMRSISGSLNIFQIAIEISLVLLFKNAGLGTSLLLIFLSSIANFLSIIRTQSLASLPGIVMNVGAILILLILFSKLVQIDKNQDNLARIAVTDSLTGLANNRGLMQALSNEIEKNNHFFFVLFDLYEFKKVNESMGIKVGDKALATVANRLSSITGNNELLAYAGSDEFYMIVRRPNDFNIHDYVERCIEKINNVIEFPELNYNVVLSTYAGIVEYPQNASSIDELIKYADIAMHEAKRFGINKCYLFSEDMANAINRSLYVENEIKYALEKDTFNLVFQPQYSAASKTLRGFETLLRMTAQNGEAIYPNEFIPIAESNELILAIDMYVINKATDMFKEVVINSGNKLILSVNISAKHMLENGFAKKVYQLLLEKGFPEECLEIEITEYCFIDSIDAALANINELKEFGIHVALDDFGTGYTSLSYLSKLPVDLLKIDKSFVNNIELSKTSSLFIKTVISLGHILGRDVLCEGVETTDQLKILTDMGCDYIQGFVWAKPMSYEDAINQIQ